MSSATVRNSCMTNLAAQGPSSDCSRVELQLIVTIVC